MTSLLSYTYRIALFAVLLAGLSAFRAPAPTVFTTDYLRFSFDRSGHLYSLMDKATAREYVPKGESAPLLSLMKDSVAIKPSSMEYSAGKKRIILRYPGGYTATVAAENKGSYLRFELLSLTPRNDIKLVLWGPYPTTIREQIGETVGVVHDGSFGIGIQALNIKTLGGYPTYENDIDPAYDIFQTGSLVDVASDQKVLYRGQTAKPASFGSVIQAYCRNRFSDRVIANWEHPKYVAPAFKDGGVIGSKIALWGAPEAELLTVIGKIELAEGLPHPMIDGVWGKQNPAASASYLIMDFGEENVSQAIALTQKAGLRYFYHGGPFENWGHFQLKKREFPNNWASMRACVEKAEAAGLRVGLHTLSNFITTNDPYVTPVPDQRLAKVGRSVLAAPVDEKATQLVIQSPEFFNQMKNNNLKAVMVGKEIIRYRAVSESAPWTLLDCTRGAFKTSPQPHQAGDTISKLMDHGYQVFLADYALQTEMASTLARLYNETGLRQISFDGLEGCWATGLGQYGLQLFVKTWYDQLKPELKGAVINDASTPGHYFWHTFTRMNWGEPWYAGFRESQTQYRLKNQDYFRRNLMPGMLGWFSIGPGTSLEDLEWMLARSAGFDAGFGLATSIDALQKHGFSETLLTTIRTWETARLSGAFSAEQKVQLRDINREFHLENTAEGSWLLTPVHQAYLVHEQKVRQPGEPVASTFEFNNPNAEQALRFTLQLTSGEKGVRSTLDNPVIEINSHHRIELPFTLEESQIVQCDGKAINLLDKQWQVLKTVPLAGGLPKLNNGLNTIRLDGNFQGSKATTAKMEIRSLGEPVVIKKR
ncbi:hypothetical protein LX87_01326 [Larkinella arboricola]|uniref:Uncharacterized protein n=1 Tax=Larkinella arboricola TaxID=643671 RepID=A0A327XAR8_LARAB|nr:hypothetical protein [Larkinella arboricola]RAK03204.1 hypothetical protein LX87_01326 [Larkinella arboricola]